MGKFWPKLIFISAKDILSPCCPGEGNHTLRKELLFGNACFFEQIIDNLERVCKVCAHSNVKCYYCNSVFYVTSRHNMCFSTTCKLSHFTFLALNPLLRPSHFLPISLYFKTFTFNLMPNDRVPR